MMTAKKFYDETATANCQCSFPYVNQLVGKRFDGGEYVFLAVVGLIMVLEKNTNIKKDSPRSVGPGQQVSVGSDGKSEKNFISLRDYVS